MRKIMYTDNQGVDLSIESWGLTINGNTGIEIYESTFEFDDIDELDNIIADLQDLRKSMAEEDVVLP